MSIFSWFRSNNKEDKEHEEALHKAREQLKDAELTDEEVRQLISELEKERSRNHYAEMVIGAFVPKRS